MVSDRNDNTPDLDDDDENGVLTDTGSIDTTGIGLFGATEHVSVSMPVGSEEDELDDDALVDDIVADEIAVGEIAVGEQPAEVRVESAVAELEAAGPDSEDAEASAPIDPYAAFAAAGFTDDGVAAGAEAAEDEHETLDEGDVVVEDEGDEHRAGDVDGGSTDAEEPVSIDTDAIGELDATSDADGFDSDAPDETDIVEAELVADDLDEANGTDDRGAYVDEVKPITDPLTRSALRQAMSDAEQGDERVTDNDRVHETERIAVARQEVALTSKRVGEFEPNRESADLLTADRLLDHSKVASAEPEGAWQQFVYSLSGKRINLGDSKRARARKELDHRISAPLPGGARFVPVLSRKGGVGKTTVTTLLGMALADARDDRVIAIDANPDRGTLAERISRPSGRTVRDLARLRGSVTGFNEISSIVARDETRLDVISSDADPHISEAFSDHDYRDVASVAAHYYSLVLTDTGTGIVHSVMGATLDLSDEIVIVAGLSVDEARLASETLTWLETNGFDDKVRRAVVVLNNQRPGAPLVLPDELEAHFRSRVRAVVRIPYDPHIAAGSAIAFRELQPATREAARELAAIVVEGLRQIDQAA